MPAGPAFWRDELGQDLAEYGLLLVLLAIGVLLVLGTLRVSIESYFDNAGEQLESPAIPTR